MGEENSSEKLMTGQEAPKAPNDRIQELHCRYSGVFGLNTIAHVHQIDIGVDQLFHDHAVGSGELSLKELAAVAGDHEMKARTVEIAWRKMPSFAAVMPCLLEKKDGHFAVLAGLRKSAPAAADEGNGQKAKSSDGKTEGYVLMVADPAWQADHPQEPMRALEQQGYEEEFTGRALLVKRIYRLTDNEQPFGLRWFMPEFLRMGGVFGNIALAVFLLTDIALAVPLFFQNVVDKVLVHESFSTLNVLGAGTVVAILFNAVIEYCKGHLLLFATNKIDISTAVRTFAHLIRLPIDFFEQVPSGVILKHMQQTERIRGFLSGNLFFTLLDICSLAVFLPFLLLYSIRLTCVVMAFTLAMAAVIAVLVKPFQKRLDALYQAEGKRQSRLVEAIHGMRTVKSLALEPLEEKTWGARSAAAIRASFSVGRISLTARSLSQALEMLMNIALIWLGALMVFRGEMTIGALIAFQMLAGRVTSPLVKMVGLIHEYQQIALSVKMLGVVMNTLCEPDMGRVRQPLRGRVTFERVSFRYRPELPMVLKDFSLDIPAGTSLGIVGRSGSGKTTLTKLLQGLYPPFSGLVKIDGIDLREIAKSHLRSSIGVVLQENYFFSGTVRENISMTKPMAKPEEILRAAMLAGAHEFVERLPQGYDTMLEENAANLSGGQRQRLAIARALLTNPRILIFDEATSALDPESEACIQANLGAIAKGRTVIVVSHRLSMVAWAERILVIDKDEPPVVGTHAELIQKSDIYRQFWKQQVGYAK